MGQLSSSVWSQRSRSSRHNAQWYLLPFHAVPLWSQGTCELWEGKALVEMLELYLRAHMAELRDSSLKELDMSMYWPERRGHRRLGERKRCQEKDGSAKTSTGNDESNSGQQRRGSTEPRLYMRKRSPKTDGYPKLCIFWEFSDIAGELNTEKIKAY